MPDSQSCRVLVDGPAAGVWNMAVDEALLESVASGGPPTLRVYRWSEPTLSLGYFQRYADRAEHPASADLPAVRRSSGGGALVHDHEVTYALALPPNDPRARDAVALTCLAHRALIKAVQQATGFRGLTTCADAIAAEDGREPFLCFQRRSTGDVLTADRQGALHKVCGSAQRRRRGALLQHGGLLLARSSAAPELPGLRELGDPVPNAADLADRWADNLLEALDLRREAGDLGSHEAAAAERFVANRFADQTWTERR